MPDWLKQEPSIPQRVEYAKGGSATAGWAAAPSEATSLLAHTGQANLHFAQFYGRIHNGRLIQKHPER